MGDAERAFKRGQMRVDAYYFTCGLCGGHEVINWSPNGTAKHARERGWTLTRADGWVCPLCSEEARSE